jgi:hypothetical protein
MTGAETNGDNLFVGALAFVLPGVTIGARNVIDTCSVLTHHIPGNCHRGRQSMPGSSNTMSSRGVRRDNWQEGDRARLPLVANWSAEANGHLY